MTFLRQAWSKTRFLLLASLIWGVFSEAKSLHETIAHKLAPAYEYSSEDLRAKEMERNCEERTSARRAVTICWYPLSAEARNYEEEHLEPVTQLLNEVGFGMAVFLMGAAVLRFAWHSVTSAWALFLRKLPPELSARASQGFKSSAGGIWSRIQAKRAEREFLRYHRLYQGGLLSEAEFEAKKRELKPKILG